MSPRTTVTMQQQGVMSPTGSCKTFDATADGYARGEAVSAIYIKKLSSAIRDSDTVRAVIRSTCTNSDGKGVSLTTPNAEAHASLMRRGHALAGISDFSKTAMVKCHGTGTQVSACSHHSCNYAHTLLRSETKSKRRLRQMCSKVMAFTLVR